MSEFADILRRARTGDPAAAEELLVACRDVVDRAAQASPRGDARPARPTALHGRSGELGRLRALLTDDDANAPRAALVVGGAGSGKSRLLEELADAARTAGWRVVRSAHDAPLGPDPFAAALIEGSAAGTRGAEDERGARSSGASRTDRLVIRCRSLAAERPLLWIADDLDLASEEDRALLGRLAAALRGVPARVVAATRPSAVAACRAELGTALSIELNDLPVEAVRAMLADVLLSDPTADRLASAAHRATDGNPLAVLEYVDALRADQTLVCDEEGCWNVRTAAVAAPTAAGARSLLRRRIAALPRADRAILETAACAGPRFDATVLARALRADPGRVLLRLARLERRSRLLRPAGPLVEFAHHEVRDAVLDGLPEERRRALHGAVGAAVESSAAARGGPSALDHASIARHFLRAGAGDRAASHVVPALEGLAAAERCTEARALASDALATPGAVTTETHAAVLLLLGEAETASLRHDAARRALEEAIRRASASGDGRTARRAGVSLAQELTTSGHLADAVRAGREALDDAVRAGDLELEERAHAALGRIHVKLGRPEAETHTRRQLALASASGDPLREGEAEMNLAIVLHVAGRMPEALARYESSLRRLRGAGAPVSLVTATLTNYGVALTRSARRAEGVLCFEEAARNARSMGNLRGEVNALAEVAHETRLAGRPLESVAMFDRVVAMAAQSGDAWALAGSLRYAAAALDWVGRSAEALDATERSRRTAASRAVGDAAVAAAFSLEAAIRGRLGDEDGARDAARHALAAAKASDSPRAQARASFAAARWAGRGAALDEIGLCAAAAALQRMQPDGEGPRLTTELGVAALRAGRRNDAAAHFAEARDAARAADLLDATTRACAWLGSLGAGDRDAGELAADLAAAWDRISLWTRVEAAGLLAQCPGRAALLDRAEEDVAYAVEHARPEHHESVRARLRWPNGAG